MRSVWMEMGRRARLVALVVLAALLATPAGAADQVLVLRVAGAKAAYENWVFSAPLDLRGVAAALGAPVDEVARRGLRVRVADGGEECAAQLDAREGGAALYWRCAKSLEAGKEHVFHATLRAEPAPAEPGAGLELSEKGDLVTVSNSAYEVVHSKAQGGIIASLACKPAAGKIEMVMDDVVASDYGSAEQPATRLWLRGGRPAQVSVRRGPVCSVVEFDCRFGTDEQDAPRALYRYVYSDGMPVIQTEARFPAQELSRKYKIVMTFAYVLVKTPFSEVYTLADGWKAMGDKMTLNAGPALILGGADAAMGVIGPETHSLWKGGDTQRLTAVNIAPPASPPWSGGPMGWSGYLYVGPKAKAADYAAMADGCRVTVEAPKVMGRVEAVRQRLTASRSSAPVKAAPAMLLDAAGAAASGDAALAEELIRAAEEAIAATAADLPVVSLGQAHAALANETVGLLFVRTPAGVGLAGLRDVSGEGAFVRAGGPMRPFGP